jgi:hypothetical protein
LPTLTAYYIDDDQISGDAERYRERLGRDPGFQCRLISPPKWDELAEIITAKPDLFLIDYDLSLLQLDNTKADYRGTTLAAEIRDRLPDSPIVLITRQSILDRLDPRTKRQLYTGAQPCDELILKDDLDEQLDEARQLLISLTDGFHKLSDAHKDWISLLGLMNANPEEARVLREAGSPIKDGEWIVTEASDWIRHIVLEFPGIFYDSVNAATRLGIDLNDFLETDVQDLLKSALYDGIFAPQDGRWWKSRLFQVAEDFIQEQGVQGPLNRAFREAFQRRYGREMEAPVCVWDHTPIADWVCYILNEPVKLKNSLRYYPDSRPSIMDPARVSFRAIRERSKFREELLDAEGTELLAEIEGLPEP